MRVLLVPNTGNAVAVASTVEIAAWCAGSGFEPVLAAADAEACGLHAYAVPPSEIGSLDLCVALGGDGTMLKAVHLTGDAAVPVLGVNFGKLGFLSGTGWDRVREAIEASLAGEARVERRATLRVEVVMEGRSVGTYRALNEVAVARGASGRIVCLDLSISGHGVTSMCADGIIVATATGSTAYALSAGGPVVSPDFGGMVVVPVAPHTLQARAIVTSASDVIEVTLPDPDRADACIIIDGAVTPCRRAIDRVVVSRDEHDVHIVKLDGRHFYETVSREFFGGR